MSAADLRCERLSELSQCAYRLGLVFGAKAEQATDAAQQIEYFNLFDRCFFSVRVATALELRLRQAPAAPREAASDREDLHERPERDDPAHDRAFDRDRDRDREHDREHDRERASLPLLLKTLHGVVADAAALPGPEPAALPSLRELLAQVTSGTAPEARALRPQGSAGTLRARLAGSAVPAMAPTPPLRSAARRDPLAGRATGPPRR